MNFENIEQNEPFSRRILEILSLSKECTEAAIDSNALDEDDVVTIVERAKIINSRCLLLLTCLHVDEMEQALEEINREEQLSFLDASEAFLQEIKQILGEAGQ